MKTISLLLITLFCISCLEKKDPHKLNSKDYDDREERVNILKKEIVWASDFNDAEFDLFNVNGFSNGRELVPGASSWRYRFVIKVDPQEVDKWTKECKKVNGTDEQIKYHEELIQIRKNNWTPTCPPEFYQSETAGFIIYKTDGIIYKSFAHL